MLRYFAYLLLDRISDEAEAEPIDCQESPISTGKQSPTASRTDPTSVLLKLSDRLWRRQVRFAENLRLRCWLLPLDSLLILRWNMNADNRDLDPSSVEEGKTEADTKIDTNDSDWIIFEELSAGILMSTWICWRRNERVGF